MKPVTVMMWQECERAWKEVDAIKRERDDHLRWRKELADNLDEVERHRDALGVALNKISGPFRLVDRRVSQHPCNAGKTRSTEDENPSRTP